MKKKLKLVLETKTKSIFDLKQYNIKNKILNSVIFDFLPIYSWNEASKAIRFPTLKNKH